MPDNIKTVFEQECRDLAIDAKLARLLDLFQRQFVNKNTDHIHFFGGHLLGVDTVRWLPQDRDRWFDEILQADQDYLKDRLHALPSINPEFHVSSDTTNLSCVWLVHAIYISKLPDKVKHEAMVDVLEILQYKFLTSWTAWAFRYPADPKVAEATYAQLSFRFAIRQAGTWAQFFRNRCEDVLSKDSIHAKTIANFDNDDNIVGMLNDLQGRIRDMLKNLYSEMIKVRDQGGGIVTTTQVVEHDGEAILRDKSGGALAYGRYLNSIVTDRNTFIREELVQVMVRLMHTMPERLFKMTLEYMVHNYRQARAGEVEQVLNDVLVHAFDFLSKNRGIIRNEKDLPGLLSKLRGVYQSSRSTDADLFSLREKAEKIVKDATGTTNPSVIASVRTGMLLYLVARAFSMQHYTASLVEVA
ncbi:hypothetical protein D3C71_78680 [compost metagenome]